MIAVNHLGHKAAHLSIRRVQLPFAFLFLADGPPQVTIRLGPDTSDLLVSSDQLPVAAVNLGEETAYLPIRRRQLPIAVFDFGGQYPQVAIRPVSHSIQFFICSNKPLI